MIIKTKKYVFYLLCMLATMPAHAMMYPTQGYPPRAQYHIDPHYDHMQPHEAFDQHPDEHMHYPPEPRYQGTLHHVIYSISTWLSQVISVIKDGYNNRSTKALLSNHAMGLRNSSQAKSLAQKMSRLNTKEKENALNVWANVRTKKLDHDIQAIEQEPGLDDNQKKEHIEIAKHEFHEDIADVQDLMQRSLKPTEILLVSPNDSGNHLFTILDIEKIDPTQPLDEQYESLEKLGDITLSQKAASHALAEHYANHVILTFNNQPVIEQILDAIPDWHDFDGQLKIDIVNILKTQIPKEYLSEKTNKQLQQEEQNLLQGKYDIKQVKDLAKEEANASGRGAKGKKSAKKKKQINK